ncbi:MAG: 50S ribosomal protein L24 [Candidatus Moanabacter tarae]|uniref:Large ribosomal subunit protein uL24 n=1 Tax=Candidatus Moanibacter tarae TaxID=2200854 RepID=A0A2Z4ABU7_9BACT|nr:MAG: 50S ribosomal protein L24 [Candidatus Moanabacter tarae]|tara:strand:+ start:10417 stop:10698 length:282 start_codon:yes stop_codon:yes gene_type:complete
MKNRLKNGDEVVILSGEHKGERGKILQVFPRRERVLVEAINMIKRHQKKESDTKNPEGGILEREAPIHLSKVMKADLYDQRRATKNTGDEGSG